MKKRFILYALAQPFAGYISQGGTVDPDQVKDGSTVQEYIERMLATDPNLAIFLYPIEQPGLTPEMQESKKFDSHTETLVDQEAADITPTVQAALDLTARNTAIAANLPDWSQVEAAVNAISSLADAKAFLLKLSRVVYWLAKNKAT